MNGKHCQREIEKSFHFAEERRVPWYGSGLGFLIGLMLVIADETVAPRPVLDNTVLKLLLVGALLAVGYFGAVAYKYVK